MAPFPSLSLMSKLNLSPSAQKNCRPHTRSVERDGEMKKQAPHQVKAVGIPERSCGNDPVRQTGA